MAKVGNLIKFYNSQNQLAVQSAGITAQLKAQAQQGSARRSHERSQADKRLKAEETLTHYRQKLEDMRQQRELSSRERVATSKQQAASAQGELSRAFTKEQSVSEQAFKLQQDKISEAGRNQRSLQQQETTLESARIGAESRQPTPEETRLRSAQAERTEAETDILGQPGREGLLAQYETIKEIRDESKTIGPGQSREEAAMNQQLRAIEEQLVKAGVDIQTDERFTEERETQNKEQLQKLSRDLDDLNDQIGASKVAKFQDLFDEMMTKVNDPSLITSVPKLKARLFQLGKGLGLTQKQMDTLLSEGV